MGKKTPKNSPKKQSATAKQAEKLKQPKTVPSEKLGSSPKDLVTESTVSLHQSSASAKKNNNTTEVGKKRENISSKNSDAVPGLSTSFLAGQTGAVLVEKNEHTLITPDKVSEIVDAVKYLEVTEDKKDDLEMVNAVKPIAINEEKKDALLCNYDYDVMVLRLISALQTPYFVAEHDKALLTFELAEMIVNEDTSWTTARELLDRVMSVNAEVSAKVPHETTARCIIYRIRKLIIDEFLNATKDYVSPPDTTCASNYFRSVTANNVVFNIESQDMPNVPEGVDPAVIGDKVKEGVIAALIEYKMELDNIPNVIAAHGCNIIHEGDYVMTYGYCPTMAKFFLEAAEVCNFTLYICESIPLCYGHLLADDLVGSSISQIMIPDCNIAVLMPFMTKVVMPACAMLFDGNLKTLVLGRTLSTLAYLKKKEVYCVAASYQFAPAVVGNHNQNLSPYCITNNPLPNVNYIVHKFDLTENKSVSKVVSNCGLISPLHASRYMTELYNPRPEKEEGMVLIGGR